MAIVQLVLMLKSLNPGPPSLASLIQKTSDLELHARLLPPAGMKLAQLCKRCKQRHLSTELRFLVSDQLRLVGHTRLLVYQKLRQVGETMRASEVPSVCSTIKLLLKTWTPYMSSQVPV